ncbi:MAG: DNA alkylation repair protein [Methanomassiliicoccaceae archaeon]|nr:DNA alkylation repair protein [Methanomassiliicoccaceae archaeon]
MLANAEKKYKEFTDTVSVPSGEHPMAGIRIPVIKEFAKDVCKGDWNAYLNEIGDEYSEDLMARGFIIAYADTNMKERLDMITGFVPLIDNWAICDSFSSALKINKKNADIFWTSIIPFIGTDKEFQIRFAIASMRFHFMDAAHIDEILRYMDIVKNDAYYVRMGIAWCVSECFIKFPERTMEYLKNNTLDKFTFNKTLSKITDSSRVSDEMKNEIRGMRK